MCYTFGVVTSILANFFGFLLFFFLVWRRLKEDYSQEQIFGFGFLAVFGLALGYFLAKYLKPNFWFWGEVVGILLGFVLAIFKFRLKFYETLEAIILGFLAWFGIFWIFVFLKTPAVTSFLATLLIASLLVLFGLLDANYKDFAWYRSGRIGFSGLTCAAVFFLARAAIASFFPWLLSFSGKVEVFISGSVSFIIFLMVYNLAREKV